MTTRKLSIILFICFTQIACQKIHHTEIIALSDEQYPDNPDIEFRSEQYNKIKYSNIRFIPEEGEYNFSIELVDQNNIEHKLILANIDLNEFIPTVPSWIRQDEYLTKIGLINQEWNRQQVSFDRKFKGLKVAGNEFEEKSLSRIDIARNCLSSFKWEVILYANENGTELPYYHGWFDFPQDFYISLFEKKNNDDFGNFETHLTNWVDPENEIVNFPLLRTIKETKKVFFQNLNNKLYPNEEERKKKAKNILVPKVYNKIQDFLTDSTTFATFTDEGLYDTKDPRRTELGRLAIVDSILVSSISSPNGQNDHLSEIRIFFTHHQDSIKTELILGGINFNDLPRLLEEDLNRGWQNSMGIANHTFYASYEETIAHSSSKSPYYAMLTDQYQNWLDSHKIGIDGPLMFLDKRNPKILHILILSFERHSFVGHFKISLDTVPK
ncbi:hypothetical protein SAMN06298216_1327 [Spirosomataceae bacterium TFI 002]|nr:hypothetical protein SAMN06298216_1327 [Spirosomataceae bacterium TFI 002]